MQSTCAQPEDNDTAPVPCTRCTSADANFATPGFIKKSARSVVCLAYIYIYIYAYMRVRVYAGVLCMLACERRRALRIKSVGRHTEHHINVDVIACGRTVLHIRILYTTDTDSSDASLRALVCLCICER